MSSNFENFLKNHEYLLEESRSSNGTRIFPIAQKKTDSNVLKDAWLKIPSTFPDSGVARISIPESYVLKYPHVESDGGLCISGDPGPQSGITPEERINNLICSFYEEFLPLLSSPSLTYEFEKEAMTYWRINCIKSKNNNQIVKIIYTTDSREKSPIIYESTLIEQKGIVIAGKNSNYKKQLLSSLGANLTHTNVKIAEIPIDYPFTPYSWPKSEVDIKTIAEGKFKNTRSAEYKSFFEPKKNQKKEKNRIVIFKAPGCSFGYLMPGGVIKIAKKGYSSTSNYTTLKPIVVERLDISWTTGRDQHSEYEERQQRSVLLIGAGALGSPVAEQLAKAGVGKLTIVDSDYLSSANISRHTLGANSIRESKSKKLAENLTKLWPSCQAEYSVESIQNWLHKNSIKNYDLILDFTGEAEVRFYIERERVKITKPYLVAWMEPFVAAAHVCLLPAGSKWKTGNHDQLKKLEAIEWPKDVIKKEPACSSEFQSYTSAAATYAVALATEAALDMIDNKISTPKVRHWIRGQKYLDQCCPNLKLKEWAEFASELDGVIKECDYE